MILAGVAEVVKDGASMMIEDREEGELGRFPRLEERNSRQPDGERRAQKGNHISLKQSVAPLCGTRGNALVRTLSLRVLAPPAAQQFSIEGEAKPTASGRERS